MANRAGPEMRVVAIAGPTASGKTAAALAIAREHDAEIISVDSALVYRGMDIGTAKPSPAELAAVPHHLIDIRDPLQAYSAAEFAADAQRLVAEINARGKLALLVGGTMLYFKALFEGLDAMPAADSAVRAEVEAEAAAKGWPAMHEELARVDPATAARLAPNDAQRIQRALEVFRVSGQPLSSFHRRSADAPALGATPLFSLEPTDRAWLHERIARRFDDMLAGGFLQEVKTLRARGDLSPDLPSMRCVGYRQAWEALDGLWPMEQLRDKGIFATRQLAKRQLTWLRSMPQRRVVPCDAPDAMEQLLASVRVSA
ncbi:tRNA (adenosine(37)-N6)-dimethylallyltransferase MiaA [Caenimonas sp. S4]|nr:tRNA (adenosine(37)-N6)-dimethylallyltransferase MiaA [Caenimonas soli]